MGSDGFNCLLGIVLPTGRKINLTVHHETTNWMIDSNLVCLTGQTRERQNPGGVGGFQETEPFKGMVCDAAPDG